MLQKMQQKDLIYLALGSNLGDRMNNLRNAIIELKKFFEIKQTSHVIETDALLLENSPKNWNIPYLNMIISGVSSSHPITLLKCIKNIEKKLGRDLTAFKWAPRVIDIDIIAYYDQNIHENYFSVPHKEIKNRDFLQYLLAELGYILPHDIQIDVENYTPLNHFVLFPKIVGIVNVTPDSFSDGEKFLDPEKAEVQVKKLISQGVAIIDIGAQSTKPGYTEISASEEISRLNPVLERLEICENINNYCISIDTYSDEVIKYILQRYKLIKCINLQKFTLKEETIKTIADKNLKIILMLNEIEKENNNENEKMNRNIAWFNQAIDKLQNFGVFKENIILDPGIGFGKTKQQNINTIRNLRKLKEIGCEIMLAHSRKSFITSFSNAIIPQERDVETIAISDYAVNSGAVDYIRVHNVIDHMKFFVAKHIMNNRKLV